MDNLSLPKLESEPQFNLERFFHLTPDVLCIAGYDGYLKKVNPAFSDLLGYSVEELMRVPVSDFIYSEDKIITSRFRENLKEKIPLLNFQNRYITKKGELVWLSWTSISEPDNELIYAIAKDITHLKKLEEERNLLLADLARLNTDLKQFTYTTSHDLRTPVNSLLSLFNMLDLSKIEDKETLEYIELINVSALTIKNTLNKYVDAVSSEKKINIQLEVLNLTQMVNGVCGSIDTLIKKSNATFIIDFTEAEEVKFCSFYLQSIFLNLISNSIKYSNPKVDLVITIISKKVDNTVQLIFADNGIGFNMEKVGNNIFGLHQRFHNNSDSKGIGLYLVQNHMHSLGGKITVKSEVSMGTEFTLTFRD
ncbi:PAS domain-containing sensor histidine kinase [Gillisia sp. M10.2A]|uniref:histidine kinase n=1 Tax=Gillisia lutea TaxID=2909668 RepID=A0ABS9EI18_9FLAO|nr:PAS domain-containing sensor histidine kinase [Gillisia lutea]MCF4101415.1 PAS domain-containing sensor histidine kinase [Gillisia lutea]